MLGDLDPTSVDGIWEGSVGAGVNAFRHRPPIVTIGGEGYFISQRGDLVTTTILGTAKCGKPMGRPQVLCRC